MITSIFINALGQAIFESCGQALLIYIVLQLGVQFFPGITSKYKYDVYYLGLTIITCWFLANLVNIYLHDVAMAKYKLITYANPMIYGIKYMPTLLQRAEGFISQYAFYIAGLYMLGLILHSFKLIGGFVHVHHIRKQKNLTQDSVWTAKALQLSKQLEMVKKVALYFSAHVNIPLTIGYFKPIIIFPVALINNLDNEQVEAILLHELAHIKRHDYLLNIVQCVMETILCFNPFVWLISKTIRQEREYCCDDMVMDAEYNNFTYSKALYIIARQNSQSYALAMASAGSKKYPLLNRIKRLNMKTNESLPKFHLLVIFTVAAIGALLAWGIPQYSMAKTKSHKTIIAVKSSLPKPPVVNIKLPVAPPAPPVQAVTASQNVLVNVYRDTLSKNASTDTSITQTKTKFKIVIEDDKGNKKEYNSLSDLPEADRDEFLKENPNFGGLTFKFNDSLRFANIEKFKMSPEWKKAMMDMKIKFNSPEWKKQVMDMKLDAEKMQKEFKNNPEWQKSMEDMKMQSKKMAEQFNSPEWKKQMEEMKEQSKKIAEQFRNNPEWQKQMEEMKEQSKKMALEMRNNPAWQKQMKQMKIQAELVSKQFNSPAWKKQMKDLQIQSKKMAEQMNSPEWKKQMENLQIKLKDAIKVNIDTQQKEAVEDSVKTSQDQKP